MTTSIPQKTNLIWLFRIVNQNVIIQNTLKFRYYLFQIYISLASYCHFPLLKFNQIPLLGFFFIIID